MSCDLTSKTPLAVKLSLEKFGADLRVARLKRGLTAEQMADCLEIHRTTYGRMEAGDRSVAIGVYASALYALGFGALLADLVDPRHDEEGMRLDLLRLPKRARTRSGRPRPNLTLPARTPPSTRGASRDNVLRIGVLGVMTGPAGFWGQVNKACAEVTAAMCNESGGSEIGGGRYRVEIVCFDDELDPRLAAEGARKLTEEEGVRYIIGPNVEQTFAAAMPVAKKNRAMLFPYSFTRGLYRPPSENSVLCQIAGYQAVPFIYRHLIERDGVETISIVAPGTPEGLRQRQDIAKIAASVGLRVLSESSTYRSGSEHLEAAVQPALACNPDVLALPHIAPADAPRLIRRARELGFRGYITTESAQDVEGLIGSMGSAADGLIMVGGASTPEMRSERMNEFVKRFISMTGSWNDEAGTKAYALEFVLATLQMAGRTAVEDIERFKAMIPHFSTDDPLAKGRSSLSYYGAKEFRQKRQIGIPLVVNTIKDGALQTLFVQQPEELLVY
jgi:branched-chain amino acid transport system substrate-binding protein